MTDIAPKPGTLIVGLDDPARARAAALELADDEWALVDEVADLEQHCARWRGDAPGYSGGLLFAEGWRDAFPLIWPDNGLGMASGGPGPLLAAAHAQDNLVVEVVL